MPQPLYEPCGSELAHECVGSGALDAPEPTPSRASSAPTGSVLDSDQCYRSRPNPPHKRVILIQQQGGFGADVGAAANGGDDVAVLCVGFPLVAGLEFTADHASLPPDFAGLQFAVSRQARQFGAGAGAARGAVVGLAGAEHEVAAVGVVVVGEQLHMVDHFTVFATDALAFQCLAHRPAVVGEGLQVIGAYRQAMLGDQEEPVAAPGDNGTTARFAHSPSRLRAVPLPPRPPAFRYGARRFRCAPGTPATPPGQWCRGRTCPDNRCY